MKYIRLEETDSTNSYVGLHLSELESPACVMALSQTRGRGQRGNSWESEPGRNLTFSILYRPQDMPARLQFAISEATALGIADYLKAKGVAATVKWPNDIYVGDRKICGILIENKLMGSRIESVIIGAGINLNQERFVSDAPNPVSLTQLTGERYDLEAEMQRVGAAIERRLGQTGDDAGRAELHADFMRQLWRGDGLPYPFRRRDNGGVFDGIISDVAPTGELTIKDCQTGEKSIFLFKEVEFIL